MPATEIVAIVTGVVGCVAGVLTTPCVRQPVAEFIGYLKEEPYENLQKLEEQKQILENLVDIAVRGRIDPHHLVDTLVSHKKEPHETQKREKHEQTLERFVEILYNANLDWTTIKWITEACKELHMIGQFINAGTSSSFIWGRYLGDFKRRYRIGKNTPKIEKRVTKLRNDLQNLGFENIFSENVLGGLVTIRRRLVGRGGVIRDIMLNYEAEHCRLVTRILGVYGAIGIGKTEVVAHLCNRILQDRRNRLINLIWVEAASYEGHPQKLQREIARKLQLEVPIDSSVRDNARALRQELMKNKRILLVLDDVRKAFSLEEIGFPTISNSKITIVITSRSSSVCSQMKCDWKTELKSLSIIEAYELLIEEVGFLTTFEIQSKEIQSSLEKIAGECGGLPLAIITVANYLRKFRGYDLIALNSCLKIESAAFSNLKYIEDKEFQDLMLSYEQLKHGSYSSAKECLLYCTMYPRNHSFATTKLVTCWMGKGLLREVEGIDKKLGIARELLEELKDASLLESTTFENGIEMVKMHPLIWDMTVKIEKENPQFFAKHECRLEKIAYEDWLEDVESVSLVENNLKELPTAPMFHKLSTLILKENPLDIELDLDFFNSFPNLKILDLSDTNVRLRPDSFSFLKHLTVLLLQNCHHLTSLPSLSGLMTLMVLDISGSPIKELPSLSTLGALMILDVSGCPIKELPDGMSHLTNLVHLNLSQTRVGIFHPRHVAELNNLQELMTIGCNFSWIWQPTMQDYNAACIEVICNLQYLSVLEITFSCFQVYRFYAKSPHCDQLRSFKFCVGELYEGKLRNNSVAFTEVEFPTNSLCLPKNASELLLKNCSSGTPWTIAASDYLQNLKFLDVSYCKNLKCLFKTVFSLDLINLEELVIAHCPNLEKVFQRERFSQISLRRLQKLTLFELPELQFIDHYEILNYSMQAIGIWSCPKLQKFPIELSIDDHNEILRAPSDLKIRGDKSWLKNLKHFPKLTAFLERNLIEEPPP